MTNPFKEARRLSWSWFPQLAPSRGMTMPQTQDWNCQKEKMAASHAGQRLFSLKEEWQYLKLSTKALAGLKLDRNKLRHRTRDGDYCCLRGWREFWPAASKCRPAIHTDPSYCLGRIGNWQLRNKTSDCCAIKNAIKQVIVVTQLKKR